jgi:hypothetical protein
MQQEKVLEEGKAENEVKVTDTLQGKLRTQMVKSKNYANYLIDLTRDKHELIKNDTEVETNSMA